MPIGLLYAWSVDLEEWVKVQCDEDGNIFVDLSEINLDDLGDVVITTPDDGDVLSYDLATGNWLNTPPTGASFATPAIVLGAAAAAGSATTVIRSDSTIAAFDATNPSTQAFSDAAVVGTAAKAARRDHKHAMMANPVTPPIRKTADQIVTNSAVLVDDDELFFPIGANEVWEFTILPIQYCSSTTGFRTHIAAPTGATGYWRTVWVDAYGGTYLYQQPFIATMTYTGLDEDILEKTQGIVINGDTPGNVQFQWCQEIAEESDTIVRANSCIIPHRLA